MLTASRCKNVSMCKHGTILKQVIAQVLWILNFSYMLLKIINNGRESVKSPVINSAEEKNRPGTQLSSGEVKEVKLQSGGPPRPWTVWKSWIHKYIGDELLRKVLKLGLSDYAGVWSAACFYKAPITPPLREHPVGPEVLPDCCKSN